MSEFLQWGHFNPVRITAGIGAVARLQSLLPPQGDILLVTTLGFTKRGLTQEISELIGLSRVTVFDTITPNPEMDDLDDAVERFKPCNFSGIVGLGGGSVIDTSKVLGVALLSILSRPLGQILRDRASETWAERHLPVIALPTTAGTGAEVTPFATVWDHATHTKHSVAGDSVFPTHALLDPRLTLTLPPDETLYSGVDAMSHALESLWNKNRTAVSSAYAVEALKQASEALPRSLEAPWDLSARASMQVASLLAGLAISDTRTAIAHAISYPLTIHHGVPHGLACGFSLEGIIEHYLSSSPNSEFGEVMRQAHLTLKPLCLLSRLERYVTASDWRNLKGEMLKPGRSDNYEIKLADLDEVFCHIENS